MKIRVSLLVSLLLASAPLFARKTTDVVVMKNGDRLTCEVKSLDDGILSVSMDYVDGTIALDWLKVAQLKSNQLFVVLTKDGVSHEGTLVTSEEIVNRPLTIKVTDASGNSAELDRSTVVRITETSEQFHRRFSGSINLGALYSKGNSATQYNLGSEAEYLRERWAAQGSVNSSLSSDNGSSVSTRNQLTLSAYHLLPFENYFYGGLGGFLRSTVQQINLQTTLGAGIGHFLKNTNRSSIALLAGLAWQRTDYNPSVIPTGSNGVAAALVVAQIKLFKFKRTNLAATSQLLPALSDRGRVRLNSNVDYYVKLFNNMSWNVSFYEDWDNRPPAGFSGSDYGTSLGLNWTFGNR